MTVVQLILWGFKHIWHEEVVMCNAIIYHSEQHYVNEFSHLSTHHIRIKKNGTAYDRINGRALSEQKAYVLNRTVYFDMKKN